MTGASSLTDGSRAEPDAKKQEDSQHGDRNLAEPGFCRFGHGVVSRSCVTDLVNVTRSVTWQSDANMNPFGLKVFEPPPPPAAEATPGAGIIKPLSVPDVPPPDVESPPLRTGFKTNVADLGGPALVAVLGTISAFRQDLQAVKVTLDVAKIAILGGSPKGIALWNSPFLFGRFNELYDRTLNRISGYENDRIPERPLIDLQGPARALYGALSYVPGLSQRFSELNRKILQRDFEPQVKQLVEAARFRLTGFQGREVDYEVAASDRQSLVDYIESGANPATIIPTIEHIDFYVAVHRAAPQLVGEASANALAFQVAIGEAGGAVAAEQREAEEDAMLAIRDAATGIIREFPMRGQGCMR